MTTPLCSRLLRLARCALCAAVCAELLLGTRAALAQHHHHDHRDRGSQHEGVDGDDDGGDGRGEPASAIHMHAGVHIESGVVDAFGGDRGYQGVMAMAGARWRAFELGAHLPAYRIELGSERQVGLGDVHVMVRYVALGRGETEIGGAAGVMLPVGDDEVGLGMGHWMAMAGGFVRGGSGPIRGELSLGYAGALGSAGHAEHGVLVWPPVAPMNAREVRADATVSATLWRQLGASVTSLAAIPLGDGEFIALVGGDITYRVGRVTVTAGARHGLAHHTLGLAWSAGVMGAL